MSVRVYLNIDESSEGFEMVRRGSGQNSYEEPRFRGVRVYLGDTDLWYCQIDVDGSIPEAVADLVEEITFRDVIVFPQSREAGVYVHSSAEAELGTEDLGGRNRRELRIKAQNLDDLTELYHMIRTGTIRPEMSYEGSQDGRSRADLEAQLRVAQESLVRMWRFKDVTTDDLAALSQELQAPKRKIDLRSVRVLVARMLDRSTGLSFN